MNNRTEKSYGVTGIMRSSLMAVDSVKFGTCQNGFELRCIAVIRPGGDSLLRITGLSFAKTHLFNYSVTTFRAWLSGNYFLTSRIGIVHSGHSHTVHRHASGH